jgi:hypothetical protein
MGRPEIQEVPAKQILEVQAFLRQREALDAWKKKHGKAILELAAIMVKYNPCLNAAEKVVRERKVTCGPFQLKRFDPDRDAGALEKVLGRKEFERRGGEIHEEATLDNALFDALLSQNVLSEDDAEKVLTWKPIYDKPKLIVLP